MEKQRQQLTRELTLSALRAYKAYHQQLKYKHDKNGDREAYNSCCEAVTDINDHIDAAKANFEEYAKEEEGYIWSAIEWQERMRLSKLSKAQKRVEQLQLGR